ncbi:MAG: hypothetical protein JSU72_12410 [Deltaproteobacteria bacterium]|nr:MAG: hypothetical protein JSU72_12410 [Deltaproteobacteria bacterium]
MADPFEAQKREYDAHRLYVKIHFDGVEMDFAMQWVLGSTTFGGFETREAFYVAGQIKDDDPESWQEEPEKMARQMEERAQSAFAAGHRVSAEDSFLKASNDYRAALVSMLPDHSEFTELGVILGF